VSHDCSERPYHEVKDSYYEELESVFDTFSKYRTNILLGEFNAKIGRKDIFKSIIGNESLHEISNDNEVIVNFDTYKMLGNYRVST
jgi:hypothetical protein